MPDWAPNIHPLLVHFPIALLMAAVFVDLLSGLRPTRPTIRDTATWFYCAGAFMAMAAYFSGLSAAESLRVSPEADMAVTAHFTWADRATWFFMFFASFRLAVSYIWRTTARWVAALSFLGALTGLGLIAATVERGGRLVFQHGLGVSSVPSTGHAWTTPGPRRAGGQDSATTR